MATDLLENLSEGTQNLTKGVFTDIQTFFSKPKAQLLMGGAVGMQGQDWFDFLFHGAPWFLLIGLLIYKLINLRPMKG